VILEISTSVSELAGSASVGLVEKKTNILPEPRKQQGKGATHNYGDGKRSNRFFCCFACADQFPVLGCRRQNLQRGKTPSKALICLRLYVEVNIPEKALHLLRKTFQHQIECTFCS